MPKVVARIKLKGKHFETHVDLDEALKIKAGKGDIVSALLTPSIYYDINKGTHASNADLLEAFGTEDAYEIAKKIIVSGEVQKTQEFRDAEKEARIKQIINLIIKNAVDQHGRPYTEERIRRAVDEIHFNFDTRSAEQQMTDLVNKLKEVIPIKIETKRVEIIIPASFTGQVYGVLKDYKESEEWLSNGDLKTVINIPAGVQIDFYDKLNSITHGAVQSKDLPQQE
ncbi:ribosome assembly factor SBDS [Candidatus Pacearchaeota archaeon]|nr:ribosome assembly factor SBDS [Candidatus Pacearchaeota archaeon]